MKEWKDAFWLTKFELRKTNTILMFIIILSLPILLLITHFLTESYFKYQFIGLEFMLLFVLIFFTKMIVPRMNDVKQNGSYGNSSSYLVALNSLPIKKDVIAKNRLLTSLFISIPVQAVFLSTLYLTSSALREAMSIDTYVVFSIIWICLSIYIGSAFVTHQAGHRLTDLLFHLAIAFAVIFTVTVIELIPTMQFESNLTFPPRMDLAFFSIEFGDPKGIIYWTMLLAKNHPIISTSTSVLLSIIGLQYWNTRMLKRIERFDYL